MYKTQKEKKKKRKNRVNKTTERNMLIGKAYIHQESLKPPAPKPGDVDFSAIAQITRRHRKQRDLMITKSTTKESPTYCQSEEKIVVEVEK